MRAAAHAVAECHAACLIRFTLGYMSDDVSQLLYSYTERLIANRTEHCGTISYSLRFPGLAGNGH